MSHRGFTAVELAVVVTILALLVPLVYRLYWGGQDQYTLAFWHLRTADQVRTIAEEIRLDARRGIPMEGDQIGFIQGECRVLYSLDEKGDFIRDTSETCGGPRGLATGVRTVERVPRGIRITFSQNVRVDRDQSTTVLIPMEGR